ncbi:hypothetical protein [Pseudomarimonas arenosa]|uniref:Right handed beta helix domain-containing protein n=1 Tax=Pseudomarimonas arenosa TaxID=2774145 RepID=A0AAW3ZLS3_9GAMM|nr:hypothetical protein [Pseudomarimonas arenosa]MBD8526918.1 hypothetical protein [Pseudomarimonas arenosa]
MRLPLLTLCLLALPATSSAKEFSIGNRDVHGLIAAIHESNQRPGPHRIRLYPGGIYTLQSTDEQRLGLPAIRSQLRIDGRGAEIRRYSDASMTLLEVTETGRLQLHRLTLAEGSLGAIRNRGELRLDEVSITDSSSENARGIVLNYGHLTVHNSLFAYNHVKDLGRSCGVLINLGRLDIHNSRFEHNAVNLSQPMLAAGAILNLGVLNAENLQFDENVIIDPTGDLAYHPVVNLDSGSISGLPAQYIVDERIGR